MKKIFLIFTVLFTCLSPVICTATSLHESFEQNQPQTNKIAPKATDSKKRASMLLDAIAELCDTEGYTSTSNTMAQLKELYGKDPTVDCTKSTGKITLNCYKIKKSNQSSGTKIKNQTLLQHYCSPQTFTESYIQEIPRPENIVKECNAQQRKKINAKDCYISDSEKYYKITCLQGYKLDKKTNTCKQDTPNSTTTSSTQNNKTGRMTAQVEELSPEDEVTAYDEHDPSQDSQGAPYATQQNNSWNTNYNNSDETPDSAPAPTPNKSASAMIAQEATRKAEKNKETCTLAQRDKINATDCKISADGKYSDIVCKNGYTKNADGTKCEKSDTPDKKAKPELIKISGIVIDATSKDEQTIGGVRIKYNEGKTDKDGNEKYAQHQTGNNGRFAINIVPSSTITFTHKMYKETTESYSAETKDVKIKMSPTDETVNDRKLQELCETNNKGTWIKTSGQCNCKDKTATFDETRGCVPAESLQFNGFVIDETGEPIPDVKVKYGNQSTKTDAQGKFTLNAPKDTEIAFSYKGYKNYTHKLTANAENQTITMEPTDKAANNAEKQKLCEKDGKGEWKPKLNKCNCKDKKAFFDEDEGCVESTEEYRIAESALETLYEQFKTQLETIQAQNNG